MTPWVLTVLAAVQGTADWSAVPLLSASAVVSLVAGAIGYGVVKNTAESAKTAATDLRKHVDERFATVEEKMDDLAGEIAGLREGFAGLRAVVEMMKDEQLRVRNAREAQHGT